MTAPVYACARCGKRERAEDTFLCAYCLDDPFRKVEQRTVELLHPGDHKAQRALLVETYAWFGFGKRLTGGHRRA